MSASLKKLADRLMRLRTNRLTRRGIQRDTSSETLEYVLRRMYANTHTNVYTHTAESNKCCDIDTETLRQGER